MAAPLKAGLAPDLIIGVGYIVRLTAVSATTGAVVPNVVVSDASLQVVHLAGPLDDAVPLPRLVPSDGTV